MNPERIMAQLNRAPDKREIGGHGDPVGFMMLIQLAPPDADLSAVALPMKKVCSNCRFLVPEFNDKMPCWDCVTDGTFPKWRAKG